MPFSEEDGGFGGGSVETMITMEAVGRGLALEPFFASVILGGNLIRLGATAEQRAELIPHIADGSLRLAFAHTEPQARYDLNNVKAFAQRSAGGFVLEGDKSVVLHGDSATKLIVSARTGGNYNDCGRNYPVPGGRRRGRPFAPRIPHARRPARCHR